MARDDLIRLEAVAVNRSPFDADMYGSDPSRTSAPKSPSSANVPAHGQLSASVASNAPRSGSGNILADEGTPCSPLEDSGSSGSSSTSLSDSVSNVGQDQSTSASRTTHTDSPVTPQVNQSTAVPDASIDDSDSNSSLLSDQVDSPADLEDDSWDSDTEDVPLPSDLGAQYAADDCEDYTKAMKLKGYSNNPKTNPKNMTPGMIIWTPIDTPVISRSELDRITAAKREDYRILPDGHRSRKSRPMICLMEDEEEVIGLVGMSRGNRGFEGLETWYPVYRKLVAVVHRRDWEDGSWKRAWPDSVLYHPIIIETGNAGRGSMIVLSPVVVSKGALVKRAKETINPESFERLVSLFMEINNPKKSVSSYNNSLLNKRIEAAKGYPNRRASNVVGEDRRERRPRAGGYYDRDRSRSPRRDGPDYRRNRSPQSRSYSSSYGYNGMSPGGDYRRASSPPPRFQPPNPYSPSPYGRRNQFRDDPSAMPYDGRGYQHPRGGVASGARGHAPPVQNAGFTNSSGRSRAGYQDDRAARRGSVPTIAPPDERPVQSSSQQASNAAKVRRKRGNKNSNSIESEKFRPDTIANGAKKSADLIERNDQNRHTVREPLNYTKLASIIGKTGLDSVQPPAKEKHQGCEGDVAGKSSSEDSGSG